MIVIGIDPGLTGALAFVDSRGSVVIEDIPTVDLPGTGKVRRKVDARRLADIVRTYAGAADSVMSVCEAVHAIANPNSTMQSAGSLMRTLGAIEAVLEVLRMPALMVSPQTWKRHYGLSSDKSESLRVARALYPAAESHLGRAKDHNRAEALLLAHYGREVMA